MNLKFFIHIYKEIIIALSIVFIAIFIAIGVLQANRNAYEKGYVAACKDFYKGKVKYDLIENEDGTKEWKKINE